MMKILTVPLIASLLSVHAQAEPDAAPEQAAPKYISEAPLPKGWPQPGPFDKVSEKTFPAYRAAYTDGKGSTFAFWRLFQHIKSKDIPMTSPVEMGMEQRDDRLDMKSMGFLYQNTEVGVTGKDGAKVEVRDVAAMKTLSYTWQGDRNSTTIKRAKEALDQALAERKLKSDDFRVLGYNGPGVPKHLKTWEMIVVLPNQADAAAPVQ